MAYSKLEWKNNVTPLNTANLNRMEDGIQEALDNASEITELATDVQNLSTDVTNLTNQVNAKKTLTATFDSSTGNLKFTSV